MCERRDAFSRDRGASHVETREIDALRGDSGQHVVVHRGVALETELLEGAEDAGGRLRVRRQIVRRGRREHLQREAWNDEIHGRAEVQPAQTSASEHGAGDLAEVVTLAHAAAADVR